MTSSKLGGFWSFRSPNNMTSQGSGAGNVQQEGHVPGNLQAGPQFLVNPLYMHPWSNHMMYAGGPAMSMSGGNLMQMMYSGFQAQSSPNPQRPHANRSVSAILVLCGSGLSNSGGAWATSLPGSLSVDSSGVRHCGSSTMAGAQRTTSCSIMPPPFANSFHGLGTTSSQANPMVSYQMLFLV
ncbi:hypothetical protein KC19_VG201600 [Ceratodon purpureus]|uniref:Uncharacterized protein n=1 Tax=Ceratodon purpureus TaxID=3225 RepID=A0A8T0HS78_CERPU|nr:hypothetical protein KC19_VG201600 [Ceratodon purpureus]